MNNNNIFEYTDKLARIIMSESEILDKEVNGHLILFLVDHQDVKFIVTYATCQNRYIGVVQYGH